VRTYLIFYCRYYVFSLFAFIIYLLLAGLLCRVLRVSQQGARGFQKMTLAHQHCTLYIVNMPLKRKKMPSAGAEHHPEGGLLDGFCLDKQAPRQTKKKSMSNAFYKKEN
jgi:hypothetical protein